MRSADLSPSATVVGLKIALIRRGELFVVPRAGHSPWLDDRERFIEAVVGFLD